MSKVTVNGTSGITGYQADDTTVARTRSLGNLNIINPRNFPQSGAMTIRDRLSVDGVSAPPLLKNVNYTTTFKNPSEIITDLAATGAAHVSQATGTASIPNWTAGTTFGNSPTSYNTADIRDGSVYDVIFTVGSGAINAGLDKVSAFAWQSTRSATPPDEMEIDGVIGIPTSSSQYTVSNASNNSKTYYQSFSMVHRNNYVLNESTNAKVTYYTGGAVTQTNDKAGMIILPGKWGTLVESALTFGAGTLTVASNTLVFIIACGNTDGNVNLFNFGTNANLTFLLNMSSRYYDNCQVVLIGNKTTSSQTISYSINTSDCISPTIKPVRLILASE